MAEAKQTLTILAMTTCTQIVLDQYAKDVERCSDVSIRVPKDNTTKRVSGTRLGQQTILQKQLAPRTRTVDGSSRTPSYKWSDDAKDAM